MTKRLKTQNRGSTILRLQKLYNIIKLKKHNKLINELKNVIKAISII